MSSWKDNLRTIDPYVPGEQPQLSDMIKLNTNENPYPPSPKARDVLTNFALDTLRLYPDPDSSLLVNAIAKRYEVGADQVFVGVGSDDVLAIAFMTFFNSKKPSDLSDGLSDIPSKPHTLHIYHSISVNTTIQVKPSTD